MYRIDKTNYGFKLTLGDFIKAAEMEQWVKDSEKQLQTQIAKFGVFVDMRTLKPLPQDAQALMEKGQKLYKGKGMERSVVILDSPVVTMQFKRLAQETGIYQWERYIDASKTKDWEKIGEAWLKNASDPDKSDK
jgi:hypothetical protein